MPTAQSGQTRFSMALKWTRNRSAITHFISGQIAIVTIDVLSIKPTIAAFVSEHFSVDSPLVLVFLLFEKPFLLEFIL